MFFTSYVPYFSDFFFRDSERQIDWLIDSVSAIWHKLNPISVSRKDEEDREHVKKNNTCSLEWISNEILLCGTGNYGLVTYDGAW